MSSGLRWSPAQYAKFLDERTRPARDLLAQVPLKEAQVIYDLGCGPGNSTALLVEAFPGAEVIGVDNSPEMLAQARRALPGVAFAEADLESWAPPREGQLLFSNATFQWLKDPLASLQRFLAAVPPGGVLAVQMPDNLDQPSHVAMREVALDAPYADKMRGAVAMRGILPPVTAYYAALKPHCARLEIWHSIYNHPLDGLAGISEWLKGTGLRPFLGPLSADEQRDFLARYEAKLAAHYPVMADGKVLLPFPRVFIVATR